MPAQKRKQKAKSAAKRSTASPKAAARKQPETLRLRSALVALVVNDLARSLAWYRDVLGFSVVSQRERDGVVRLYELQAGNVRLRMSQDDWAKGRDRKKGEAFRIRCETAQPIEQIAARIKQHGGTLESEPQDMPWGDRMFSCNDPDGFHFTFVQLR
jgi:uncharacterized glyoxalase superfamily protein PhnB